MEIHSHTGQTTEGQALIPVGITTLVHADKDPLTFTCTLVPANKETSKLFKQLAIHTISFHCLKLGS